MATGGYPDDVGRIVKVLGRLKEHQNELKPKKLTTCDFKEPSTAARLIAPDFREKTVKGNVKVVRDSFQRTIFTLEAELGENLKGKSPQEKGQIIHQKLATRIEMSDRSDAEGQLLTEIEEKFRCRFFMAEVSICGYSTKKSKIDFYSGQMDALAYREGEDYLEVLVVDWKSSSKDALKDPKEWWDKAVFFKTPLYQSLIYRELLKAHLKENEITARVGVMLVPLLQKGKAKVMPGLCKDFQSMHEVGLLDKIKEYEWFGEQSTCVHTISLPSNLLNLDKLYDNYVEEGSNVLKREILVKGIIKDDATVGDLCQELGLLQLQLKVRNESHEEHSEAEGKGKGKNKDEAKKGKGIFSSFRGKRK